MKINFDLISDLNLTSLDDFSWTNKATSLFCIIAGNISSDRKVLVAFLEELSTHYEKVFFIDGDLEHAADTVDFVQSYKTLAADIAHMKDVIFLHENIVLMNGATIMATNGWTTFDFCRPGSMDDNIEFLDMRGMVPVTTSAEIFKMAVTDQHYLSNSINSCQSMSDCQNIIMVSSAVPLPELINHDVDYDGTLKGNTCGNSGITNCLNNDTEQKITTWLFGKYHGKVDSELENIRYTNNPRMEVDLGSYYPKLISFN